jgi:hypothetical protein
MILTEVKFFSETLTLGCAMYVLLPQRSLADAQKKPQKKFRTLYLLHGHSDDHTAWQRWTSIERFVEPCGGDASSSFELLYRYGLWRELLAIYQRRSASGCA